MKDARQRPLCVFRRDLAPGQCSGLDSSTAEHLVLLGTTHCRLSPPCTRRPADRETSGKGDEGGADTSCPGIDAIAAAAARLHADGLGVILDVAPGYIALDAEGNQWWYDVLENGRASPFARYFDIDWDPVKRELKDRILLPILDDQYGAVLERGDLRLGFDDGRVSLDCAGTSLPINPRQAVAVLRHGLERLLVEARADDRGVAEFLSILTALQNLPSSTETDAQRIDERHREKEIARERLVRLVAEDERIAAHVATAVREFNGRAGDASSFDRLHELLDRQPYRLSCWKTAAHEVNFRRFLDRHGIAALRIEDPDVFAATHRDVLALARGGDLDGVYVVGADILWDPEAYFRRLRESLGDSAERGVSSRARRPACRLLIVTDTSPAPGATQAAAWPIDSTAGSECRALQNGLFVEPGNARSLRRIYDRFTGQRKPFGDLVYESRKLALSTSLASEVNLLTRSVDRIAERDRRWRDFTRDSLRSALIEVIACLPCYRTYVSERGWSPKDHQDVDTAVTRAQHRNPAMESSIFGYLRDLLLMGPADGPVDRVGETLAFVVRFQQCAWAVSTAAIEETALFRYNVLLSWNEAGTDPANAARSVNEYHEMNERLLAAGARQLMPARGSHCSIGADAGSRIDVLSEVPDDWRRALGRWVRLHAALRTTIDGVPAPDRNDQYRFYQALLGSWPIGSHAAPAEYIEELQAFMLRSALNAKTQTSRVSRNRGYEEALLAFVSGVLAGPSAGRFLDLFLPFQARIAESGLVNSMSKLLLTLTSPAVPQVDLETEDWDLRLNSRKTQPAEEFARATTALRELLPLLDRVCLRGGCDAELTAGVAELVARRFDGRLKKFLLAAVLRLRRSIPGLFVEGAYEPLRTHSTVPASLVAFRRRTAGAAFITVVPRLFTRAVGPVPGLPLGLDVWKTSRLFLPPDSPASSLRNVLTGESVRVYSNRGDWWVLAGDVLRTFPVALLTEMSP